LYAPLFFALTSGNFIVPLHLTAMICMLYDPYFVSRSFVTAQTGKMATFQDYAGQFLLLWFYAIGVWALQPKVNELYVGHSRNPLQQ
jgi:hypothetical protein